MIDYVDANERVGGLNRIGPETFYLPLSEKEILNDLKKWGYDDSLISKKSKVKKYSIKEINDNKRNKLGRDDFVRLVYFYVSAFASESKKYKEKTRPKGEVSFCNSYPLNEWDGVSPPF